MWFLVCTLLMALLLIPTHAFQHANIISTPHQFVVPLPRCRLFMGRAAAVRAATKAKTDDFKAKNNNRYAKKIIMAVKAGGPDPVSNRLLNQLLQEAKDANVPKDIITRNIEKAVNAAQADFKESVFEYYGHGGVGLLVNVLSDNDNRASADVNLVAKKHGLKPAATNSVAFKFTKKTRLDIQKLIAEEELMELCLEHGVDDYELRTEVNGCLLNPSEEGHASIYVDMKDMVALREALRAKNYLAEIKLVSVPQEGFIAVSDEAFEANMAAISAFESLDDVDSVEHNIDMTD